MNFKPSPDLRQALIDLLDEFDAHLRAGGYGGPAIDMFLAGGLAVNFYCGTRSTEDVDAFFSRRVLLPSDLAVAYRRVDGTTAWLYFDTQYNPTLSLMHEDAEDDALVVADIGNERRLIQLRLLAPVDLAVSKLSRFGDQDRADIVALAEEGLITAPQLRTRALEALSYYVGDATPVRTSLNLVSRDIEQAAPHRP